MDPQMEKLEQQITDHIENSVSAELRNEQQHQLIIDKLEAAMLFQKKLQWVGGTVLLMIGTIAGFIVHNAHALWDTLPRHGH